MISIIVPVYKVEKYLPRCIESLINQTFQDLEIILVDDGSPDGCPRICDEYAQKDDRIIVIHQPNGGVSAARNHGLRIAKGEWIGFCDSDDYVDLRMYEQLHCAIKDNDADIAVCGYDYVDEDGRVTRPYVNRETEILDRQEMFRRYFDMPPTIRLGVCNKLFRKSMLEGICFTEGIKGAEDGEFLNKYLQKIHRAVMVHQPLYKNCERAGSATRGGLKGDSVLPALDIYMDARRYVNENYPQLRQHAQAYYLDACLLNYNVHCKADPVAQAELICELRKRVVRECLRALLNPEIYWKTRIFYLLFAIGLKG